MSDVSLTTYERHIIKFLRITNGYTTIWWLTDNQKRARASAKLEKAGILKRDRSKEGGYPTVYYDINLHEEPPHEDCSGCNQNSIGV